MITSRTGHKSYLRRHISARQNFSPRFVFARREYRQTFGRQSPALLTQHLSSKSHPEAKNGKLSSKRDENVFVAN